MVHEHRLLEVADYVRMNLPQEFWRARRDRVPASVVMPVQNYCENIDEMIQQGLGFVLSGPPGVGKTSIAALIAKEARSHRQSVFFVPVADLRELMRNRTMFDESSVFERCRKVKFLVLDALREEDAKDHTLNASVLEALVVGRSGWKLPTLLTTRLNPRELKNTFSGLMEALSSCSAVLPVMGENQRASRADAVAAKLLVGKKP